MEAPAALRGAVTASSDGSVEGLGPLSLLSRASTARGSTMDLTRGEARIIWIRNLIVLLLSLVVGTKTLVMILRYVGGQWNGKEGGWIRI